MPDVSYPIKKVSGVPVITAPADIDMTNADLLSAALAGPAAVGQATIVVDMTATQFCDSAGLLVLVRAHKRAVARGSELRLVLATPTLRRLFAVSGVDHVIPTFPTLALALAPAPAPASTIRALSPTRPRLRLIA
jgi:anti-sigma B factor antagonist